MHTWTQQMCSRCLYGKGTPQLGLGCFRCLKLYGKPTSKWSGYRIHEGFGSSIHSGYGVWNQKPHLWGYLDPLGQAPSTITVMSHCPRSPRCMTYRATWRLWVRVALKASGTPRVPRLGEAGRLLGHCTARLSTEMSLYKVPAAMVGIIVASYYPYIHMPGPFGLVRKHT